MRTTTGKEKWTAQNDVNSTRDILTSAFAVNPSSKAVWMAAANLEWETGEGERARVLFQRERAGTERVHMKSALLELETKQFDVALELIEVGIFRYPKFEKLFLTDEQICSDDLEWNSKHQDQAREFYQQGIQNCPS
eukprot:CAMPEP_0172417574 /NCGR_PEP_ID=MMETSP1064-20121228/4109_1 /TAXON_ID=202472 /ORGANISM="Aulacoseira subarctica , Strain CCAP 1002/5" /LENGTH=136 /DNA_ID=CAMNT_0013156003 /DNA_START=356 /DNA_END=762 /DNA_ORIENTATION=+